VALVDGIAATEFSVPERIELGITLTDDAQQLRLNRRFRAKDASTNVLAFRAWNPEIDIPPGAPLLLGDIVLAFETVVREAIEQAKPLCDHVQHLIVHGVLHLLGYDHREEADAVVMERLEISILARLGVTDPYLDIHLRTKFEPVFE
jgi:probable rRNA maturation factor